MIKNVRKTILFVFVILLNGSLCFSQNKEKREVIISRAPFSYNVLNRFSELRLTLKMMVLSDYKVFLKSQDSLFSACDSSYTEADSIVMTLKSGVSWELLGKQPKLPPFFLLRKNNQKVKDGINFSIFKSECEARDSLPYEMIEKFDVFIFFRSGKKTSYLTLFYEIMPDSSGKMKIIDKTVKFNDNKIYKVE